MCSSRGDACVYHSSATRNTGSRRRTSSLRRSWTSWLSTALVLLCCAAPVHAAQPTTRVFAMQPKLDLAWLDSRQSFHDKLFGLADTSLRGPGKPLIQTGADDFASHLRPVGRNL